MAVISEIRLTVSKTVNCGNYESVKIEGTAVVGKDSDDDTGVSLRQQALDEVLDLLKAAYIDHVPQHRLRGTKVENEK